MTTTARTMKKADRHFFHQGEGAEAIEAHRELEGFRDYPVECFEIHEAVVDRSNWNEGFTTVRYEE